MLAAAIQQFYAEQDPPAEVHVPVEIGGDDAEAIESWLSERAGRRVRLLVPRRGEKRGLLDLATRNAALAYQTHFGEGATVAFDALDELRRVLDLPVLPRRIECVDISTLQGRDTVASLVVCVDGRMRKGEYRKFRIRGQDRARVRRQGPWPAAQGPWCWMTSPPSTRSCCGATGGCSSRGGPSRI